MSGFDRNRFIGLKDEDFEDIKCGICLEVMNNPFVTHCCQQSYCCECIREWINDRNNCPNCRKALSERTIYCCPRFALKLISKLDIRCDFNDNGCEEVVKVEQLSQHLSVCPFNTNNKCEFCNQMKGLNHFCIDDKSKAIISDLKDQLEKEKNNNRQLMASFRLLQSENRRFDEYEEDFDEESDEESNEESEEENEENEENEDEDEDEDENEDEDEESDEKSEEEEEDKEWYETEDEFTDEEWIN